MVKKRIATILLVLVLCFSFCVPVLAAETEYIIDESGILTDEELEESNKYADYLAELMDIDFIYVYTRSEDLVAYAEQLSIGKRQDQVLMVENDEYWYICLRGMPEDFIDEDDELTIREAFCNEESYEDGISAYMYVAAMIIWEKAEMDTTEGQNNTIILDIQTRVVDMAELLDDSEEASLLSKLDEISERQKLDVVVVTVNTLDGKTPMDYADDFYDYNGYGFGEQHDGVLLLVSIEDRDWWISTSGYGITAFTDAGIEYISEKFLSDLSSGNYADAFTKYAELCDEFITQARTGEPYDTNNMPKGPFKVFTSLFVSLVVGLIVALVVTGRMKGKLKTVRFQPAASEYVKSDSMILTENRDTFLFSRVDRRAKPKDNDSGSSGSSTHTSSSGSSHGGGGGKF